MDLTDDDRYALLDAAQDESGMAHIDGIGSRWQSLPNPFGGNISVWYSFKVRAWHKRTGEFISGE